MERETTVEDLATLAARERRLRAELEGLERSIGEAVVALRESGVSWDELSRASNTSARQLRWRMDQLHVPPAAPRPSREGVPQHANDGNPESTVTVSEAARRLQLASRSSVYKLIRSGELSVVAGSGGRQRVTLDSIETYLYGKSIQGEALSISEAARRLGSARATVVRMLKDGRLQPPADGDTSRVSARSVSDLLSLRAASVSVSEASRRSGKSREMISRMLEDGRLQRAADSSRVLESSLEAFVAQLKRDEKEAWTVSETAEELGLTIAGVHAAARRGALEFVSDVSGQLRVPVDVVRAYKDGRNEEVI